MQLMVTFAILIISIILFMSNRIRSDLVAILALLALVLADVIDVTEAFAGFSNTIIIMIAGLFIVGAGIFRTGLAHMAGSLLLKWAGNSEKKLFILLLIIVAIVGAFMSNTGIVALMIPIVISITVSLKTNPAKYLIPLAFIANMSGLLTLIATPTNLIVSQTLADNGFSRLSFFEITPVGIVAVITVIVYLYVVRNKLLPNRKDNGQTKEAEKLSPYQLAKDYRLGGYLFQLEVTKDSELVGKKLADLAIPKNYQLFIIHILRKSSDGIIPLPITYQEMAGPSSVIQAQDILFIQGSIAYVDKFIADYSLINMTVEVAENLVSKEMGIAEVILTPHSTLINETIQTVNFREKYNLNILGLNRNGKPIMEDKTEQRLRFGDTLLVQGNWDDIDLLSKQTQDVVVIGQPREHAQMASASGKAPIAGAIMLFMVLLMVLEVFPVAISVLIGAVLMVLTGCVRNMNDAYSQVNWETIVLIAAMLPMATALEKTGGMTLISEGLIYFLGSFGVIGVFAGIYVLTASFGQFISNSATAVLFSPIALNVAISLDASPVTFLIAVTAGASMSFLTPVASPTNALVMAAGNYRFSDFVKIGIPLQIVMFFVMMITIPFFFPF